MRAIWLFICLCVGMGCKQSDDAENIATANHNEDAEIIIPASPSRI